MAKSLKDRLLSLGAAAAIGFTAIPLSALARAAGENDNIISVPVSKTVDGDYTGDEAFEFVLEPVDGAPMPEGKTQLTVSARNGETVKFDDIKVDLTDLEPDHKYTYKYKVTEKAGTAEGMTYDDKPQYYTVSFVVVQDEDGNKTTMLKKVNPVFAGDYSIRTVLQNYNVFVKEEYETGNHNAGGFAANVLNAPGSFHVGDGAPFESYAGKIIGGQIQYQPMLGGSIYDGKFNGYSAENLKLYYNTLESGTLLGPTEQTDEQLINFDSAFSAINAESPNIANTPDIIANESNIVYITEKNFHYDPAQNKWVNDEVQVPVAINIKLPAEDCKVTVPKELMDRFVSPTGQRYYLPINLETPSGDVHDFQKYAYTISFPDMEKIVTHQSADIASSIANNSRFFQMSYRDSIAIGLNGNYDENLIAAL